jgi:hypothetical protein
MTARKKLKNFAAGSRARLALEDLGVLHDDEGTCRQSRGCEHWIESERGSDFRDRFLQKWDGTGVNQALEGSRNIRIFRL